MSLLYSLPVDGGLLYTIQTKGYQMALALYYHRVHPHFLLTLMMMMMVVMMKMLMNANSSEYLFTHRELIGTLSAIL